MNNLRHKIKAIDGRSSSKYTSLYGGYYDNKNELYLKNIHGAANNIADTIYTIPMETMKISSSIINNRDAKVAAEDYILREIGSFFDTFNYGRNNGSKGYDGRGAFLIFTPDQRVLRRSMIRLTEEKLEIYFRIILPIKDEAFKEGSVLNLTEVKKDELSARLVTSKKGLVNGKTAEKLLCRALPGIISNFVQRFNYRELDKRIRLYTEQQFIRGYLKENRMVAFVGNGAMLPRNGTADVGAPSEAVVPFSSPESLKVKIDLPSGKFIEGMGISEGVSLIVGAGYHGKSTLIAAIEHGTYNHVLGDGREYVITEESALSIFAEDGRSIKNVDISLFLNNLPSKTKTDCFSTETASGSTSQAAAVMEAVEAGCRLLLIDEDRSANNFMMKDARMQKLIPQDTITPYIDLVRHLYQGFGVSSILVIGGNGDYLDVADCVIQLESFKAIDMTVSSKEICQIYESRRNYQLQRDLQAPAKRILQGKSLFPYVRGKECLLLIGDNSIQFGEEILVLQNNLTWPTDGQLCAILLILRYIFLRMMTSEGCIVDIVEDVYKAMNEKGMQVIAGLANTNLSDFEFIRPVELVNVINRMRMIQVK